MNDYFSLVISIFTILGIGWKANEELSKIRKELKANTETTVDAKKSTVDTGEDLKKNLEAQFIRLQQFNATRYREISEVQYEMRMELINLREKVKTLENIIIDNARNTEPKEPCD